MEGELEVEVGLGHKRTDPEGDANGGDVKRPREVKDDHRSSMAMEEEEDDDDDDYWPPPQNPLDAYRKNWISMYGRNGASFEDETQLPPMRNTDGPVISFFAKPMNTVQVFFVKVTGITGALRWPLDVYGIVAVRDSLDQKRNILLCRRRDECQTLTSLQDSTLELRGPSRAVVLMDPVAFEINLKVKGKGGSPPEEDKVLSYYAFLYNGIPHYAKGSYAMTKAVPGELSTMEVRFAHVARALEATIEVRLVSGSTDFKARLTARTASIEEEVLLLDSRGRKVTLAAAAADDGSSLVVLQRRVVVVEDKGGELTIGIKAARVDNNGAENNEGVIVKEKVFCPRSALRSDGFFDLGFSRLYVLIAWSMLP